MTLLPNEARCGGFRKKERLGNFLGNFAELLKSRLFFNKYKSLSLKS
jgi:hypothetical protein